jgi:hypothetical protein
LSSRRGGAVVCFGNLAALDLSWRRRKRGSGGCFHRPSLGVLSRSPWRDNLLLRSPRRCMRHAFAEKPGVSQIGRDGNIRTDVETLYRRDAIARDGRRCIPCLWRNANGIYTANNSRCEIGACMERFLWRAVLRNFALALRRIRAGSLQLHAVLVFNRVRARIFLSCLLHDRLSGVGLRSAV